MGKVASASWSEGLVFHTEDQSEHAGSALSDWWARSGWTSLLLAAIVALSAVVAFTAVRAWYVPVRATGLVPATLTVDTQPPGAELRIDTVPRGTAPLSILTDPPGARVTVDDRLRGVSPLVIDDLAEGEHTIAVRSDAGSARRTVAVSATVAKEVVFSFPKAAGSTGGWLIVASPFPVDILEGDEVIGTSGRARIMLPSGRHDVVLRNESLGYAATQTIDVVAGRTASVEVKPPTGLLNVNATPWADVLIDGRPAGQTPLGNIELPIGPHQITFRHPELGERTRQVVVAAQGVSRVAENLTR